MLWRSGGAAGPRRLN